MKISVYAKEKLERFKENPKTFSLMPCMNDDQNKTCGH